MVFRSFYWRILIRAVLLSVFLWLFSYCIVEQLHFRSVYMGVFAVLVLTEMVYYVYRFSKNIELFLINIQQREFTLQFQESDPTFGKLFHQLNNVTAMFRKINSEKEVQYRFLQTLVKHLSVGILSFDDKGNVQLLNDSALKMIGNIRLSSLGHLRSLNPSLAAEIERLGPEQTTLVKIQIGDRFQNVALFSSEFKLERDHYKLVSMQNITAELSAQELKAWQKLIRVLTHEIMNSIAPIISLSDTLYKMMKRGDNDAKSMETIMQGIEAIKVRSKGLQIFTDAYRKLTRIPAPEFTKVSSETFIQSVVALLRPEFDQRKIKFNVQTDGSELLIDQKLFEQVLINVLWNAIDAVASAANPTITILVANFGGQTRIQISDNGVGIDESIKDKVFVPFFTTKKNGSGIGLALARQIVQMHKGALQIESAPGTETTITILL